MYSLSFIYLLPCGCCSPIQLCVPWLVFNGRLSSFPKLSGNILAHPRTGLRQCVVISGTLTFMVAWTEWLGTSCCQIFLEVQEGFYSCACQHDAHSSPATPLFPCAQTHYTQRSWMSSLVPMNPFIRVSYREVRGQLGCSCERPGMSLQRDTLGTRA